MGQPRPLFRLCSVLTIKHYTIVQQNNVKKYPTSIQRQGLNPQPSDNKSPPLTNRPGLLRSLFRQTQLRNLEGLVNKHWAVIIAHWADQLLTTQEGPGSNRVRGIFSQCRLGLVFKEETRELESRILLAFSCCTNCIVFLKSQKKTKKRPGWFVLKNYRFTFWRQTRHVTSLASSVTRLIHLPKQHNNWPKQV